MKITSTSRSNLPAAPAKPTKEQSATTAQTGWQPKSSSAPNILAASVDDAIALKPGASFNVRLGHIKQIAGTFGKDATAVVTERLASKLPASSPEERARIYRTATTLGADSTALKERLMKDAVKSGDAKLALELLNDGVKLSKADRVVLAPHIRSDDVLQNGDNTKNLARAAISVLADQPQQLEAFARSISSPAVLFAEVLSNKDTALAAPLASLTKLLTPKEADGLARRHSPVTELRTALQTRAAEK